MSSTLESYRIGADVGGTFTDIVIELLDGSFASTKVLTTHDAPERGILDGIDEISTAHGIELSEVCLLYTSDAADE